MILRNDIQSLESKTPRRTIMQPFLEVGGRGLSLTELLTNSAYLISSRPLHLSCCGKHCSVCENAGTDVWKVKHFLSILASFHFVDAYEDDKNKGSETDELVYGDISKGMIGCFIGLFQEPRNSFSFVFLGSMSERWGFSLTLPTLSETWNPKYIMEFFAFLQGRAIFASRSFVVLY